jgi:hypothetical protein
MSQRSHSWPIGEASGLVKMADERYRKRGVGARNDRSAAFQLT